VAVSRLHIWAWRFARRRIVGFIGRKGHDVYMFDAKELEVVFRGRQCR
jgi:hypothetical protein